MNNYKHNGMPIEELTPEQIDDMNLDYQPDNDKKCKCGGDLERLFIFSRFGDEPVETGEFQCSDCEKVFISND